MLRMDGFDLLTARTAEEAVALYASNPAAMFIAGGTDIVPNLKHRIVRPRHLISLAGALSTGWERTPGHIVIGAGTRLSKLTQLHALPPLAQAAALIASPQIRNMGTIGGNVFLDTRCIFYNQTEFWRHSLGYCLKAVGDWCHVINSGRTCVAAQSSDLVPVLLALDARLRLLSPTGSRELSLRKLFHFNGMQHLKIEKGELLTHIIVPQPGPGFRGSYQKLRTRDSIDFPMLGVAITGTFAGQGSSCVPTSLEIVVGALNPAPRPVRNLDTFLGKPLTDEAIDRIAELTRKQSRPQGSVQGPVPEMQKWRRTMSRIFVQQGLRELTLTSDMLQPGPSLAS